ncbi:MAG: M28 family peptidase [Betaproteobacteria bacterium]|nr:M28 family peptidase [Betaproteobacteria bacterium]
MKRLLLALFRIWVAIAVILGVAMAWMTVMPGDAGGKSGVQVSPSLASSLQAHVTAIAGERNIATPAALDRAAAYIETQLAGMGYDVKSQWFDTAGVRVRNIYVIVPGTTDAAVVVGAHYDSARHTAGADDNASGVAALLELARTAKSAPAAGAALHLVFFTNEEPPYFRTQAMGSYHYADSLSRANTRVTGMFSLEMLGYYCDVPGCQRYPFPLSVVFPDKGNFIGFVSNPDSRGMLREVTREFRKHAGIASEGIAAPTFIQGVDYSDQQWFWHFGWPAVMVTDTSFMRNPHYHKMSDTPDKLDYSRMAAVVDGLTHVIAAQRAKK